MRLPENGVEPFHWSNFLYIEGLTVILKDRNDQIKRFNIFVFTRGTCKHF